MNTQILENDLSPEIVSLLLDFYNARKRDLPWRRTKDPYAVWVSEIMLQQTRVEAVIPYYERFLKAFPDLKTLSEADDETLYKHWEGLGYYSRVRNMRKAAQICVADNMVPAMPTSAEDLRKLPGIGSYTAGAIASIAYGEPSPAVDGNVLRVVARLTDTRHDILDPVFREEAENAVRPLIPGDGSAGDFNQSLIELGALVCLPNGVKGIFPRCSECPLDSLCLAHQRQHERELPIRIPKSEKKILPMTVLMIYNEKRVCLRKRPSKGLLAGMYEFPTVEGRLSKEEALKEVKAWGLEPIRLEPLPPCKHIFTHRIWEMIGYRVVLSGDSDLPAFPNEEGALFAVSKEELDEIYPLPSAFSSFRNYIV